MNTYHLFPFLAEKYSIFKVSEIEREHSPGVLSLTREQGNIQGRVDAAVIGAVYIQTHNYQEMVADRPGVEPSLPKLFRWNLPLVDIQTHAWYWHQNHTAPQAWEMLHRRLENSITTGEHCWWQNVISQFVIFKNQK